MEIKWELEKKTGKLGVLCEKSECNECTSEPLLIRATHGVGMGPRITHLPDKLTQ